MATVLTKRVKRVTIGTHRNGAKSRHLVVTLHPGDTISIREQGRRTGEEFISIASVYQYATRCRVAVERMEKAKAKKAKGEGRA
jgi:hypothetical protein